MLGKLEPYNMIKGFHVNPRFLIADSLVVDILLETRLINQHILEIQPGELKVVPRSSQPSAISSVHSKFLTIP